VRYGVDVLLNSSMRVSQIGDILQGEATQCGIVLIWQALRYIMTHNVIMDQMGAEDKS
jgi:hypothetical protein